MRRIVALSATSCEDEANIHYPLTTIDNINENNKVYQSRLSIIAVNYSNISLKNIIITFQNGCGPGTKCSDCSEIPRRMERSLSVNVHGKD